MSFFISVQTPHVIPYKILNVTDQNFTPMDLNTRRGHKTSVHPGEAMQRMSCRIERTPVNSHRR